MSDDDAHAQWSADCDFCDNTAEHYCKSCGIKLCSPCKDDHLSKKLYRLHEAVPYTSGIGHRTATQSECSIHPGERYQLYCKPCEAPVCSTCVVESHGKHDFSNISDAYDAIKSKAMSQLQTLSQTIRPCLRKELEGLNKSQKDILGAIVEVEQKMKDIAQKIHNEVDDILAENMKEIQKIKDDTVMPLLQEEVRNVKEKLSEVDEEILSYDKHLRSKDLVDLLKFMKQRDEDLDVVTLDHVDATPLLPSFTPGAISRKNLHRQFGTLVTVDYTKVLTSGNTSDLEEIEEENIDSEHDTENLTNKNEDNKPTMKLIPNPVCQTEFTVGYNAYGIRLRSPNAAWIHDSGSKKFYLLDGSGNVVRTVDAGCTLYYYSGMCIMDDGGLVYSDRDNRCIRSLSPHGQVRTLFSTKDSTPLGLCRLMRKELVVGMEGGAIRIYNVDGRLVGEVKSEHVNNPYYITINKLTGDICLSDNSSKVVTLTKYGGHRFTYFGHGSGSRFNPCDLCSDRQGRVFITDCNNFCVHIVDKDGQFIQYLASEKDGIKRPVSIDVDGCGNAWVGEEVTEYVKIIKYLE